MNYQPATAVTILSLAILIILALAAPISSSEGAPPIVIMYAFDAEGALLEERMNPDSVESHLGRRVAFGTLTDRPVVLAESGVGMTNAALTTQYFIDQYHPSAVIFSGIAGALDSSLQIGDIVVCSTWTTHDYGYWGAEGFVPQGVDIWFPAEDSVRPALFLPVDSALYAAAATVSETTLPFDSIGERLPRLVVGAVGTSGNTFIDNSDKRQWLVDQFDGDIVDMESAAVAQVCAVNAVPYLAIRSASDLAGGSGSATARDEIREFFRVAARNSSLVVLQVIETL